ncbi:MAG: hypothetical protein LBD45_03055, partial [Bacteroidales bacterium]|nr:hypothetical protein [Bacteroidales bacterium]
MKVTIKKILRGFIPYGILKTYWDYIEPPLAEWRREFYKDYELFKKHKNESAHCRDFVFGKLYPCLGDKYINNGSAKGDYFHQDLLVARRVYENKPEKHIDVGSSIFGFVSHVASF